jgi:hypothetical protein
MARLPRRPPQYSLRLQHKTKLMLNTYLSILAEQETTYRGATPFMTDRRGKLVPLAGIEPALLAELDFESSASTNSAIGATRGGL